MNLPYPPGSLDFLAPDAMRAAVKAKAQIDMWEMTLKAVGATDALIADSWGRAKKASLETSVAPLDAYRMAYIELLRKISAGEIQP